MSEPYVGEIRMFAGNFAPQGWAFCDGQLLAVSQYDALFSLLGTIYGGDGRTTFGLPDMRGRIPLHLGQGPGLTERREGSKGGSETLTLTVAQMPSHHHGFVVDTGDATTAGPLGAVLAEGVGVGAYSTEPLNTPLSSASVTRTGGAHSHTNLMPSLCVNFIISLYGVYPSRH
ncbi:phage tail protein [Oceanicola sp. S124]|uniref:phage tail protein n=1 Tax=Oceanicola sp. S124 TaxID=1042378 RepID=UPI00025581B4|nr:tail fiber protein [Oceanicola sp. S124]